MVRSKAIDRVLAHIDAFLKKYPRDHSTGTFQCQGKGPEAWWRYGVYDAGTRFAELRRELSSTAELRKHLGDVVGRFPASSQHTWHRGPRGADHLVKEGYAYGLQALLDLLNGLDTRLDYTPMFQEVPVPAQPRDHLSVVGGVTVNFSLPGEMDSDAQFAVFTEVEAITRAYVKRMLSSDVLSRLVALEMASINPDLDIQDLKVVVGSVDNE